MKKQNKLCLFIIVLSLFFTTIFIYSNNQNKNKDFDYSSDDTTMPDIFKNLSPDNENDSKHVSVVLPEKKQASVIYIVNPKTCTGLTEKKGLNIQEKFLLTSLQGIVAQDQAQIYIGTSNDKWIKYVKKEYGLVTENKNNLKDLLMEYKNRLNGYVKIQWNGTNYYDKQANTASTLSGLEQLLILPTKNNKQAIELQEIIETFNLPCKYDLTTENIDNIDIIKNNLENLNKDIFILQEPTKVYLRDFGIAAQAPFYFYETGMDESLTEDFLFSMNPLSIAFGWEAVYVDGKLIGEVEDSSIERLAKHNIGLIPADFCENLTLWNSLPREKLKQKEVQKYTDNDKNGDFHYATLLYSDGDNIQCWQNSPFDQETFAFSNKNELAIGWTATPILLETMPMVLKYLYQNSTQNEEFICSISGYTFTKISDYNKAAMQGYVKKTARLMKDVDMKLLAVKDDEEPVKGVWDEFAKYKNIEGGFFMYGKYKNYAGNIYWSNDKPLIYDREILWDREDPLQSIEEHPAKVAVKLNHYTKDKTKAEGYSFIQVHSWSYKYKDLYNVFYENLDLNQVKVVPPSEFVSLISENISHENNSTTINNEEIISSNSEYTGPGGFYIQEAYPLWHKLDNTDKSINYKGSWTPSHSDSGYNRTSHRSCNKGDTIELNFSGTAFKLFINTSRDGGEFDIYLDKKRLGKDLSCYGRNPKGFVEIFSMDGLEETTHTIKIKVLGKACEDSYGNNINFDAFFYK